MIERREYLNELIKRMNNGLVKVVTGIRRCGKSFLLTEIFYKYLISQNVNKDHILIISIDELQNMKFRDPFVLDKHIRDLIIDDEMYYLIIDEIQEVDNFVPLLNGLMKIRNLDIYVTGSNSKFLSKDIITEFRGRGDVIHLYPLSFLEFYNFSNSDFETALNQYMNYGGMPFILNRKDEKMKMDYLKDLYETIYFRDIIERYKIRNDEELIELLKILSSSIGSLTNPTKLENTFKSIKKINISKNTIHSYLDILEDSFLIKKSNRYDIKGKKFINSLSKFYFTDLGLRNALLNFREIEVTHVMENLIFNELLIRGFAVDIGIVNVNEKNENGNYTKKQIEIDFIASKGNKKYYIQSAYSIYPSEKFKQELRPFVNVNDSFKKVLIVKDNISKKVDDDGIILISLKEFLLNLNIVEEC